MQNARIFGRPRATLGLLFAFACTSLGLASACSGATPSPESCSGTELIIGLDADFALTQEIATLQATGLLDGAELRSEVRRFGPNTKLFPDEYRVQVPRAGRVGLKVRAYPFNSEGPFVGDARAPLIREIHANLACGEQKFVRLRLDRACAALETAPGGPPSLDTNATGKLCGDGLTCVQGACVSSLAPASALSKYDPNWRAGGPDACSDDSNTPAQLAIGNGQTEYFVTQPGATLQVEAGPQGGHHVWVALRQRGLRLRGTVVSLTASQPGSALAPRPFTVIFDFAADEGGFCKLPGLRFQLDTDGGPISSWLGKPLDITAEAKDPRGRTVRTTLSVMLAPTLVGR